jgi:hypothetical protein
MNDFSLINHGSLWQLTPISNDAKTWVHEHVAHEPYQKFGESVMVEPRYIAPIVEGMLDEGLTLRMH